MRGCVGSVGEAPGSNTAAYGANNSSNHVHGHVSIISTSHKISCTYLPRAKNSSSLIMPCSGMGASFRSAKPAGAGDPRGRAWARLRGRGMWK